MSIHGFEREIDSVGRVVIPKQLRTKLDIEQAGSKVIIYSEGNQIIIKKATATCVFCLNDSDLVDFQGKKVCASCIKQLKCK